MPSLFVITGANGAGKSTLSKTLLPPELSDLTVFDGDKFFVNRLKKLFPSQVKSPKYAREQAFEDTVAEFDCLVEAAIKENANFAYEGHFSSEAPWETISKFRAKHYRVIMIFLMVESLSLSQQRVSERVKTGGHFVTSQEVEKNYYGNMRQLNNHLHLLDELLIIDNSSPIQPDVLVHQSEGKTLFNSQNLPDWALTYLPNLLLP